MSKKKSEPKWYFSHDADASHDDKLVLLRKDWMKEYNLQNGWEANGLYWAVIEKMCGTANHKLKFNDVEAMAEKMKIDDERLTVCIKMCIKRKLFVVKGEEFFSLSHIARMKLVDIARQNKIKAANERWKKH